MAQDLVRQRLKQYLLGQLTDPEMQQCEEELITDDAVFKELLVLEDELIDDYLAGELTADARLQFESHFLSSAARNEKLSFARTLNRYISERNQKSTTNPVTEAGWKQSSWLRTLAYAALVLGVVFIGWQVWVRTRANTVEQGLLAFNEAYRERRPLQSRLTDQEYAPYSTTRGSDNSRESLASRRAELLLNESVSNNPTAAARDALGRVLVARGELDQAVQQFQEALKAEPNNWSIYNDLGVALLEKGKRERQQGSNHSLMLLGQSTEALNKAIELNPNALEPYFNRALAYQEQSLSQLAEDAWAEYLKRDSTSPWSEEAERNLEEIRRQRQQRTEANDQVSNYLRAYREHDDERCWRLITETYASNGSIIANRLLSAFLKDEQIDGSRITLDVLNYLAQLERDRAGDAYHVDVVRFYSSVSPAKKAQLAKLHDLMDEAYGYFVRSQSTTAIKAYTEAQDGFEAAGDSPETVFAKYRLAHSYVLQADVEISPALFEQTKEVATDRNYRWLAGQSLFGLANVRFNQGRHTEAIERSREAVDLFRATGYIDGLVRTQMQLANAFQGVNRSVEALDQLQQALAISSTHPLDPLLRWGLYSSAALVFDSLNLLGVTVSYQLEALHLARSIARPLLLSRSYEYLGATYAKLKDFEKAIANLQLAYDTGSSVSDQPSGIEMMANSTLQLGDTYRLAGNFSEALSAYDRGLDLYERLNFHFFSYAAHRGRLLVYLALHDDLAIQAELKILLSTLDDYRAKITEPEHRNSFFEMQQEVYDVAVNFAFTRQHDPTAAFDIAEQSRARSLLDQLLSVNPESTASAPFRIAETQSLKMLQERMSAKDQLLQYSILNDKLLIWLVRRGSFTAREVSVSKAELTAKVETYLRELQTPAVSANTTNAVDLFRILIGPVQSELRTDHVLVIVPDKVLHYLPFGTLKRSTGSHYLVEDYKISYSPSANVFVDESSQAELKGKSPAERLLSVGNPAFDRRRFPGYPDLPSALKEAATIAPFYNASEVLLSEQASETAVRRYMRVSDVVHLALHYNLDESSEMESSLMLSGNTGAPANGDGDLKVAEIFAMKFPRTRLAVLSACQTGIDRQFDGEGAIGVARPFLAAGVPLVVASLWPVDSDSTAELMIRFHRARRPEHHSTVEALQLAQLSLLRSTSYSSPYYWAPFVLIGGSAKY